MTKETDKKIEELLKETERIQRLADKGAEGAKKEVEKKSVLDDIEEIQAAAKTINSASRTVREIGRTIYDATKPVADFFIKGFKWYEKNIWDRFARKTDKETGEKTLSKKRAGTVLLATYAAVAGVSGMLPGAQIVRDVAAPVGDLGAMVLPGSYKHKETLYLSNSQELGGTANTHSVKGCKTDDCSDGGVYFLVRNSWAHNLWSLAARGKAFYVTDLETATITPGLNKCETTSYGYRFRFLQAMDAYPTLLQAKCTPIFNTSSVTSQLEAAPAAPAATVTAAPAALRAG